MFRFIVAAVLVSVATAQRSHKDRCEITVHVDCTTFGLSNVCGSDNKTYANHCDMAKARCLDETLEQQHEGACGTPANGAHVNGHEISFKIYCFAMERITCGDDHELLCGTNNQTYPNMCSFEKAKCLDVALDVKNVGACKQ